MSEVLHGTLETKISLRNTKVLYRITQKDVILYLWNQKKELKK